MSYSISTVIKIETQKHVESIKDENQNFEVEQKRFSVEKKKSEFSNEDRKRIKSMIKMNQQYENLRNDNTKKNEQITRLEKEENERRVEEEKRKKHDEKLPKIIENIELIVARNLNRSKINQEQNKKLAQLQNNEKLFEKMYEDYQKANVQEKMYRDEVLTKIKLQSHTDFESINQHADQHDEIMSQMKESWLEASRALKPEAKKFYQSIFLKRIAEREEEVMIETEKKKLELTELQNKKEEYSKIVREKFKPKIKEVVTTTLIDLRSSKSLSNLERYEQGNSYMKEVRGKLNFSQTKRPSLKTIEPIFETGPRYSNYLTEMRIENNEKRKQMISEKPEKKLEKEIKKIINDQSLSEKEKFLHAKEVAKRAESCLEMKNPLHMLDSINAKLEILKYVSG